MCKTNGSTRLAKGHSENSVKQEGGVINPKSMRYRGAVLDLCKRNERYQRPHRFVGGHLYHSPVIVGREEKIAKYLRCQNHVQGIYLAANAFQPSNVCVSWLIWTWIGVCLMTDGRLEPNLAEEQSQLSPLLVGSFRPQLNFVHVSH